MRKAATILSFLTVGVIATATHAGQWSDYGELFPLFPCQDGWLGCIIDGDVHNSEMAVDSKGFPMAASDRVGWNDLKATKVFSPFPRLSEYDGTMTAPEEEEAPPAEDVPDVAPEERNDDVVAEAPSNVTANDRVPRNDADLSQPVAMDEQKPSAVVDEPVVAEVPVREEVAVETPAATEKAADKEPVAMVRPKDGPPNNIQVKPQQKDAVASVTETKETAKPTNSIISTTPAPKAATDDSCDVPTNSSQKQCSES